MSSTAVSWPYYLKVKPIVQWPGAMVPANRRKVASFRAGFGATVSLLERELQHLTNIGRREAILQMALPDKQIRRDGYPYANAKPDHPGVIVTIESKWGPLSYPCDTFDDWQDNLRAIAKGLEALRLVDRYGVTKNGEQYAGFKQLGAGPTMTQREAAEFLLDLSKVNDGEIHPGFAKVTPDQLITDTDIRQIILRHAAKRAHPDGGGTPDQWTRYAEAKRLVS